MARPQWRVIAEHLASRLASHAYCDNHPVSDPDPSCPFCEDRATYGLWLAAGGQDHRLVASGRAIGLDELDKIHAQTS